MGGNWTSCFRNTIRKGPGPDGVVTEFNLIVKEIDKSILLLKLSQPTGTGRKLQLVSTGGAKKVYIYMTSSSIISI